MAMTTTLVPSQVLSIRRYQKYLQRQRRRSPCHCFLPLPPKYLFVSELSCLSCPHQQLPHRHILHSPFPTLRFLLRNFSSLASVLRPSSVSISLFLRPSFSSTQTPTLGVNTHSHARMHYLSMGVHLSLQLLHYHYHLLLPPLLPPPCLLVLVPRKMTRRSCVLAPTVCAHSVVPQAIHVHTRARRSRLIQYFFFFFFRWCW